ncbi:MAG: MBL fold metallo-hydrolase [Spirochaetaceae bacterium]|nr:MAG: MBL fold metallo-hydrolase [Spirochaetaceae bacterium]
MILRISPIWWPLLIALSPIVVPLMLLKYSRFRKNSIRAASTNKSRINHANAIEMTELDFLELTALVEWKAKEGYMSDAGVSYLLKSNFNKMLFDVGFGPDRPALTHNASLLKFDINQVDALTISHLHCDHMGGIPAQRLRQVVVPAKLMSTDIKPCFLPDTADAKGFKAQVVTNPQVLVPGIVSTGPLSRSLFIFGYTEEQALLALIKGKGLVVITGCGHPTIETILSMVRRISSKPVYAICGGLHFPISGGRGNRAGIQLQTILGTGKPIWKRITDEDLTHTIEAINEAGPEKVLLSAHDTCDHTISRMEKELRAEVEVIEAGETYSI